MKGSRRLANFDFVLLGLTLALLAIGVLTIYSATHDSPAAGLRSLYVKQLLLISLGLGAMGAADFTGKRNPGTDAGERRVER